MSGLSLHRVLYRAALAGSHVFAWVMLFDALRAFGSVPGALAMVTLAYGVSHALALFLAPLAGLSLKNGVVRTLSLGVVSYAAALLCVVAAFSGMFETAGGNAWLGTLGFAFFYALHRALYFAPFALEAGTVGYRTSTVTELGLALMPILAGALIIRPSGYVYLLCVAAGLALVSLLPVRALPERYERFDWTYGESFAALVVRPHRRLVFGALADGMQGAGLLFFWPLAIFFIVRGSYLSLGFVLAITLVLTLMVRHIARPYLASRLVWSPDTRATIMLASWLMRFSAFSPLSIALADTVYYSSSPHRVYALDPMTLEQVPDGGSYIDEITTLKEMAYSAGKVIVALIAAGAALTQSVTLFFGVAFVCAIFGALISVYLVRSEPRD